MVMTQSAAQFLAWRLGSSLENLRIQTIGLGTGSGTEDVTNVTLVNETNRSMITGSPDFTNSRKVSFQADFNSVTMSGTNLTEFGLFASGASNIGSVQQREYFSSVNFDGTNELQIYSTIELIPG